MRKIICTSLLLYFVVNCIFSQQIPLFSSHTFKPFLINPAMTGSSGSPEIFALNRNQFSDFEGNPQMNLFSFESPLLSNKAYAGFQVYNQRKGISSNTSALASYSYRINFSDEVFLKLGMSLGVLDQSINYSKLMVTNFADPYLFMSEQRKTNFDGNAGLAFQLKNFTIGFSSPQLFANRINYKDASNTRTYYQLSRHYLTNFKLDLNLSPEIGLKLSPIGFLRFAQGAPLQYDAGIQFSLDEKFWISALYRNDFAIGIQGGIILNRRFSVGYSYDYMIGDVGAYAGMSHELMLAYRFGKLKPRKGEDTLSPQDKKIIELQQQIDDLKKNGVKTINSNASKNQSNDSTVKAARRTFTGKNSIKEDGIYINNVKASDFSFTSGTPAKKGYYMVVETLFYLNYAEQEMKHYSNFSFPDADIIVDKKSNFYYVYVYTADNQADAISLAKEALKLGAPDCWIQHLID